MGKHKTYARRRLEAVLSSGMQILSGIYENLSPTEVPVHTGETFITRLNSKLIAVMKVGKYQSDTDLYSCTYLLLHPDRNAMDIPASISKVDGWTHIAPSQYRKFYDMVGKQSGFPQAEAILKKGVRC